MMNRLVMTAAAGFCLMLAPTVIAGECEGDVTGDGAVDFNDIVGVILDYGCESECTGDANGDGLVDFMDIVTVIQNYGCGVEACESNEDCDDGDPCTRDICTPFGCINIPIDCK